MAKVALGRGLDALLNTKASPEPDIEAGETIQHVPLRAIVRSPMQPRKEFRDEQLDELVESIRNQGIIQPLIVRKVGERYELIAGERRWRAAGKLGLDDAPVIVRKASDQDVLEIALVENLQREGLNPIEEAEGYARLARDFELRQEDIARKVGRSRASVANAMRLLDLEEQVRSYLAQDRLSVGHAKVLLALKNAEEQRMLAEQIIRRNASVRETERMLRDQFSQGKNPSGSGSGVRSPGTKAGASGGASAAHITRLESRLREHFGTKVTLHHSGKKGRLEIEYYGPDDLQRLLDLLGLPDSHA